MPNHVWDITVQSYSFWLFPLFLEFTTILKTKVQLQFAAMLLPKVIYASSKVGLAITTLPNKNGGKSLKTPIKV